MQATLPLEFVEYTADDIRNASSFTKARDMIIANFASPRLSKLWLLRGLKAIYARQTADEKQSKSTLNDNGIGFSSTDARFLTSLALQVIAFEAGRSQWSEPLSPKQFVLLRIKMRKYAMQLARIARVRKVDDISDGIDTDE